jgi:helix-turn-helix protein
MDPKTPTDFTPLPLRMLPDGRLDTRNAALYLGCSPKTLAHMRCSGKGPSFLKPGRVFYFLADLDAWLAGHGRRRSTTPGAAAVAAQQAQPP